MTLPRKAVVIGNCQCLPLACALTVMSAQTVFDYFGVHVLAPDRRDAEIAAFAASARQEYGLILSIPLSDEFQDLSSTRLRQTFDGIPVVTVSNIYFSGLHPDLCYVGAFGNRIVQGPIGDYHSRLALYAFLSGRDEAAAASLFCDETYRRLGYYGEYARSSAELARRDAGVDIPVGPLLQGILRRSLGFYSVNHPTSAVFAPYAHHIVQHLARRGCGQPSGLPPVPIFNEGTLADSAIFPVYPEIAQQHGIALFGSYAFKPPGGRRNPLDLRAFLDGEYAAFRQEGAEPLRQSALGRSLLEVFGRVLEG